MNGKQAKKIHKLVNREVKISFEDLALKLSQLNLRWRLTYAIRIIFKINPKILFAHKNRNKLQKT